MVSVLPAHLALEMKTEMVTKVRKAYTRSLMTNNEFKKKPQSTPRRVDLKTSVTLTLSSAAQKISSGFAKPSSTPHNPKLNHSAKLKNSSRKGSDHAYITDRSRSKSSAFHDLHIKTHNNVRYAVSVQWLFEQGFMCTKPFSVFQHSVCRYC
jgi:hypothetical protein